MSIANFAEVYKAMSAADKQALKELKDEVEKRTGKQFTIGDMLRAVTPGFETPPTLIGL